MRSYYCLLLFFICRIVLACDLKDDTGKIIHLDHPVKRIVSLSPDLTEILFAVGAGDKVVGIMRGSDYPPQTKKIPVVANYNSIDSEAILALHPDLIVSWTDVSFSGQLKKLPVPVYFSHQKWVTDIPNTMRKFSCITDHPDQAEKSAQMFLQHYQQLKNNFANKKPVTVFYQVWSKPLITVTKKSWINELIILCGGKNIFADLQGTAPEVNLEAVVVANPDVIIGSGVENWNAWPQLSAVQHHHVITLNHDLIDRAGPRILVGAENLCRVFDSARMGTVSPVVSLLPARFLRWEKGRG